MGTKYETETATGYNASPPSDDGTAVSTNEIKWDIIKPKLADPVKTLADNINTKLVTALDQKVVDKAVNFTTTAAEHNQTVNVTAAVTISLGDASTMDVGYIVTVKNSHTAAITVDLATGADTLDGTAAGSVSLSEDQSMTFVTNSGADGYKIQSSYLLGSFPGDVSVGGDLTVTGDITYDSIIQPKVKIIEIGDWNMDADISTSVNHGLTLANIRDLSVLIRKDSDGDRLPLGVDTGSGAAGYFFAATTAISLNRAVGGAFDSTDYDSTTYNRGWVVITYV